MKGPPGRSPRACASTRTNPGHGDGGFGAAGAAGTPGRRGSPPRGGGPSRPHCHQGVWGDTWSSHGAWGTPRAPAHLPSSGPSCSRRSPRRRWGAPAPPGTGSARGAGGGSAPSVGGKRGQETPGAQKKNRARRPQGLETPRGSGDPPQGPGDPCSKQLPRRRADGASGAGGPAAPPGTPGTEVGDNPCPPPLTSWILGSTATTWRASTSPALLKMWQHRGSPAWAPGSERGSGMGTGSGRGTGSGTAHGVPVLAGARPHPDGRSPSLEGQRALGAKGSDGAGNWGAGGRKGQRDPQRGTRGGPRRAPSVAAPNAPSPGLPPPALGPKRSPARCPTRCQDLAKPRKLGLLEGAVEMRQEPQPVRDLGQGPVVSPARCWDPRHEP